MLDQYAINSLPVSPTFEIHSFWLVGLKSDILKKLSLEDLVTHLEVDKVLFSWCLKRDTKRNHFQIYLSARSKILLAKKMLNVIYVIFVDSGNNYLRLGDSFCGNNWLQ